MSNEVIIDGCNVAECKHLWKDNSVIELNFCRINFDNNYFSNGIPCCDKCNKHPDCYFKQLQRAKAELEQYKIKYPIIDCYRCKNFQENKVLKAENEKLKEHLKQWQKFLSKGYCDCEVNENLREENERLKEEIKIQDNLAEHFRKEALYWAKKAEEIIKEAEND